MTIENLEQPTAVAIPGERVVDLAGATVAAAAFLRALGVDCTGAGLRRSPHRMAAAYAELLHSRDFEPTSFPNDEGYRELVLVRDIAVQSVCEHHLLPFSGVAHIGYLPGARLLGLSKFARVVELFARRPQVQERLTQQVADWFDDRLHVRGVGVVIEAEHSCMTLRGVRATAARTRTAALSGILRDEPAARAEFLAAVG